MKGTKSVAAALKSVARRLGRDTKEVDPYIDQLKQNWYDDVDSMADVNQDDLLAMGIPLRIAKELLHELDGPPRDDYDRKGRDKGKDKGREKGRDKDKGKDKDRDRGKGKGKGKDKDKDEDRIIRASGASKGKGKERGKDKNKDEAFARVHDIPIVTESVGDDFPWMSRILGEKRRNAIHVQKETGVSVWLHGGGTDGSEGPLTLSIRAKDDVSDADFDKAVEICEDLLEHVYEEAAGWAGEDDDDAPKKRGKSKGKDKGKSDSKGKGKDKDKGKRKRDYNDDGPESKRRK